MPPKKDSSNKRQEKGKDNNCRKNSSFNEKGKWIYKLRKDAKDNRIERRYNNKGKRDRNNKIKQKREKYSNRKYKDKKKSNNEK